MSDADRHRAGPAPATAIGDWSTSPIPGVWRRTSVVHVDERGAFSELWRATWTASLVDGSFQQVNLSRSGVRVLRGMHFHLRQADLWTVIEGRAFVAVSDLRAMAAGQVSRPEIATFDLAAGDSILLPALVAHGF